MSSPQKHRSGHSNNPTGPTGNGVPHRRPCTAGPSDEYSYNHNANSATASSVVRNEARADDIAVVNPPPPPSTSSSQKGRSGAVTQQRYRGQGLATPTGYNGVAAPYDNNIAPRQYGSLPARRSDLWPEEGAVFNDPRVEASFDHQYNYGELSRRITYVDLPAEPRASIQIVQYAEATGRARAYYPLQPVFPDSSGNGLFQSSIGDDTQMEQYGDTSRMYTWAETQYTSRQPAPYQPSPPSRRYPEGRPSRRARDYDEDSPHRNRGEGRQSSH